MRWEDTIRETGVLNSESNTQVGIELGSLVLIKKAVITMERLFN